MWTVEKIQENWVSSHTDIHADIKKNLIRSQFFSSLFGMRIFKCTPKFLQVLFIIIIRRVLLNKPDKFEEPMCHIKMRKSPENNVLFRDKGVKKMLTAFSLILERVETVRSNLIDGLGKANVLLIRLSFRAFWLFQLLRYRINTIFVENFDPVVFCIRKVVVFPNRSRFTEILCWNSWIYTISSEQLNKVLEDKLVWKIMNS